MNKTFVSNLVLVIAANLLVKPIYIFGIDRSVQNEVGASEYGIYFALFNFVYLFQIFNDFGIQNFNHSVFSKYDVLIPKYLPKILGAKLILAFSFAIITLLSALLIGYRYVVWPLLSIIILNQILASLLIYLRTTTSALSYFKLDSILSVSDKFLMILLAGYLLIFQPFGDITILQFILCQTAAFCLSIFLAFLLLRGITDMKMSALQIDRLFTISLFRKSFPYAMVLFLMTMYTRMDGVMIERMLPNGDVEAGIYAASYRILDAFSMIGVLFAGLLLPIFAKLIKRNDSVQNLTYLAHSLLLPFAITLIAISTVYHEEIINLLYRGSTVYWGSVYQMLMISFIGICLSYVYGTLLTAHESIGIMNRIFVVGVFVNLILNVCFIYFWQAWGAAIATVITQCLTALALTITAHRRLSIRFMRGSWLRISLYSILMLMFSLWSHAWPMSLVFNLLLVGMTGLIGSIGLGIIRPKDLWSLSDLTEY